MSNFIKNGGIDEFKSDKDICRMLYRPDKMDYKRYVSTFNNLVEKKCGSTSIKAFQEKAKQWISEIGTKTNRTFQGYIWGIEDYCTRDIDVDTYKNIPRVIRGTLEPLYEMRWPDHNELLGLLLLYGSGFELGLPYKKHGHGN